MAKYDTSPGTIGLLGMEWKTFLDDSDFPQPVVQQVVHAAKL